MEKSAFEQTVDKQHLGFPVYLEKTWKFTNTLKIPGVCSQFG